MALKEISRRKPLLKNRVEPHIEQAVLDMAIEQPAYGQVRVAQERTRRRTFISPTEVRSVWLRNDLHSFQRRLKALEAKLGQEPGRVLTESQVRAMEKAKEETVAHGEKPSIPAIWAPRTPTTWEKNPQPSGYLLQTALRAYIARNKLRPGKHAVTVPA